MNQLAIGVLDSGIGGLSVVKELKKLLPKESIEYFADHAANLMVQGDRKKLRVL